MKRGVADTLEEPPRWSQSSPCQAASSGGGVVPTTWLLHGSGRFRLSVPFPWAAGLPKETGAKQPQERLRSLTGLESGLWSDSLNKWQFLNQGLQTGREVWVWDLPIWGQGGTQSCPKTTASAAAPNRSQLLAGVFMWAGTLQHFILPLPVHRL